MQIENELYNSLQGLNNSLNNLLKDSFLSTTDSKLERFLYDFEKKRFEIYERIRFFNTFSEDKEIHFINIEVSVLEADKILKFINKKLPNVTK